MTDSTLRELERRFRASGSVEDEAAWLRARVQAGELEQSKLELAAVLCHEAARTVGAGSPKSLNDVSEVAQAIHGKEEQFRAALAALRSAWQSSESLWAAYPVGVAGNRSRIESVEAWICCPCDRHRNAVEPTVRTRVFIGLEDVMKGAGEIDGGLMLLAEGVVKAWTDDHLQRCLSFALVGVEGPAFEAHILKPIQAALVPYLLGYRDPVRDRVEARQREAANE